MKLSREQFYEIKEILICTTYHVAFGVGETAEEIASFKERAIKFYLNSPQLHCLVDSQLSAIIDVIENKSK